MERKDRTDGAIDFYPPFTSCIRISSRATLEKDGQWVSFSTKSNETASGWKGRESLNPLNARNNLRSVSSAFTTTIFFAGFFQLRLRSLKPRPFLPPMQTTTGRNHVLVSVHQFYPPWNSDFLSDVQVHRVRIVETYLSRFESNWQSKFW